ncbi:Ubiquitin-like-conjugating enzyme ATG3 [Aphelenchoides besseyi]|nr:Ubiquitin-like-conjugating enzyme ATG3 [Aphelenchoides besseyi]KAI6209886.1 Ubiquitin-like-conjugating enzyme ATG3 [Aphelenchoides besseyi]
MENIVNSVKSVALKVGEAFTPILKESKFKETGVLTPEEFVAAGDHLVHHCPTWSWSKAADPAHQRDYLPADKQFLITRRVPCHRRCAQIEYNSELELIIKDPDTQEEWVDTHFYSTDTTNEVQMAPSDTSAVVQVQEDDDEDDDAPPMDMDDYMQTGRVEVEDPNCYKPPTVVGETKIEESNDKIVRTRTYDLHITYDKYYQVPRFWLMGYDESDKLLTVEKMYEDFSADHANKTITIESHPHLPMQIASIHPCRHAEVMKRLIEQYAESGRELQVVQYLLIFLKFVQAIIPTIEYDYTKSIQL